MRTVVAFIIAIVAIVFVTDFVVVFLAVVVILEVAVVKLVVVVVVIVVVVDNFMVHDVTQIITKTCMMMMTVIMIKVASFSPWVQVVIIVFDHNVEEPPLLLRYPICLSS